MGGAQPPPPPPPNVQNIVAAMTKTFHSLFKLQLDLQLGILIQYIFPFLVT